MKGRPRKYLLNHDYFNQVDTEAKAYFLGLLTADGSIKKRTVSISLNGRDHHILETFKEELQYTGPVRVQKELSVLEVASIQLITSLADLNVVKNKTFKTKFPVIPKKLYHHFIRGVFDGDGCIYAGKIPMFIITGYISFVIELQKIISEECNLNITKLSNGESLSKSMRWSGRKQVCKIRDWLYQDATVYLHRKYNKFYGL